MLMMPGTMERSGLLPLYSQAIGCLCLSSGPRRDNIAKEPRNFPLALGTGPATDPGLAPVLHTEGGRSSLRLVWTEEVRWEV
jgi:hypothetical protein